jgi:ankyrin repeat protein
MVDERLFSDDINEVKQAIADGANIHAACFWRGTPLLWAARVEEQEIACALLDAGADPNISIGGWNPPLYWAAAHNDQVLIRRLIDAGADVNRTLGRWKETPLIRAALAHDWEAAANLLAAGAEYLNLEYQGKPFSQAVVPAIVRRLVDLASPHSALISALLLDERKTAHDPDSIRA